MKTLLLFSFLSFGCFLNANSIEVQDPGGHPKKSDLIVINQKFRTLENVKQQSGTYVIEIKKGTVGVRLSEHEWFIAQGSLKIHNPKPLKGRDGQPFVESPLIVRHAYGILKSRGFDQLVVNTMDDVRWFPLSPEQKSTFQYRRRQIDIQEGQLFIANRGITYILEKEKQTFSDDEVYYSTRQKLLLNSQLIGTSASSTSGRNLEKQDFIQRSNLKRERKHARSQARRNFQY